MTRRGLCVFRPDIEEWFLFFFGSSFLFRWLTNLWNSSRFSDLQCPVVVHHWSTLSLWQKYVKFDVSVSVKTDTGWLLCIVIDFPYLCHLVRPSFCFFVIATCIGSGREEEHTGRSELLWLKVSCHRQSSDGCDRKRFVFGHIRLMSHRSSDLPVCCSMQAPRIEGSVEN